MIKTSLALVDFVEKGVDEDLLRQSISHVFARVLCPTAPTPARSPHRAPMTNPQRALLLVALLSGGPAMALELASPAFGPGGAIPARYTCDGGDVSPPLEWRGIPSGTKSLVLIVDDPDAPDPRAPKMTWVHWVLVNLPADLKGLPESVAPGTLPAGTIEGVNDWKRAGYGGPCPPVGRHRCFHKLYALDRVLIGLDRPTKAEVEAAMKGHVLGHTELVGTYEKKGR